MKFIIIAILAINTNIAMAQTLSESIDSIYNFKPGKLTDKEQEGYLPALDRFWGMVKGDTTKFLPLLRFELSQAGHNPFFYYDGSGLLLSLSGASSDKELAVQSIAKCDLDDISRKFYVMTLNQLAQENIDVTPAAIRILYDEKYSFFIPEHAMTFNQGYCLTYMLLPLTSVVYIDTLIKNFSSFNTTAKKSIITTLWFAYSCKGDDFIKSVIADQAIDAEVRRYAKQMMSSGKLSKEHKSYLSVIGKENMDEMRRNSLQRFSDEAIGDLDLTTRVMRSEQKCR